MERWNIEQCIIMCVCVCAYLLWYKNNFNLISTCCVCFPFSCGRQKITWCSFTLQFDALHFCMRLGEWNNNRKCSCVFVHWVFSLLHLLISISKSLASSQINRMWILMRRCCNHNKHHISIITAFAMISFLCVNLAAAVGMALVFTFLCTFSNKSLSTPSLSCNTSTVFTVCGHEL